MSSFSRPGWSAALAIAGVVKAEMSRAIRPIPQTRAFESRLNRNIFYPELDYSFHNEPALVRLRVVGKDREKRKD